MRVTAKPSRSTSEVEIDLGTAVPRPTAGPPPPTIEVGTEPATVAPPTATAVGAERPPRARRGRLPVAAAVLVLVVAVAAMVVVLLLGDSPDDEPSPPSGTPPPTVTASPTASATATPGPEPEPEPEPGEGSTGETGLAAWAGGAGAVVALAVVALLLLRRMRRRPARHGPLRKPRGEPQAGPAAADQPRASLGSPDVLVLTESATEDDVRLRERVRDREQAVFANLQLACSFYPTADWVFSSARLTVVLAREDGRAAPAPIAYSLRPLSDRDGSAREQSVEIGADMKFVSVKGGERSTAPGEEFVRGYGLQESVSYWDFTATQHHPLQGSYLLWLIARAPRESDLTVTSTLQVRLAPRNAWSRAEGPEVAGTGEVSLVLGLKDGPPYRARLGGSPPEADAEAWLVDVR